MEVKLFYSFFFIGLNIIFLLLFYRRMRFKPFSVFLLVFIIIAIWAINYKCAFISNKIFMLLLAFSFSIIVIGYFSRLSQMKMDKIFKIIGTKTNVHLFVSSYRKIRHFFITIFIPVGITIGQLSILWE